MSELDQATSSVLTTPRALPATVARAVAPVLDDVRAPQFPVHVVLARAPFPRAAGEPTQAEFTV